MQSKARMTFRFDPPQPASRPQPVGSHAAPLLQPELLEQEPLMKDRDAASSETPTSERKAYYTGAPLQDDLYTLEQLIRNTETIRLRQQVTAPPLTGEGQAVEDRFDSSVDPVDWSLPEETERRMESWMSGAVSRRGDGPSWWRVFASVAGAVATGALFGYLVLTLFTGDSPFPAAPDSRGNTPAQASPGSTAGTVPAEGSVSAASQHEQAAQAAQLVESSFYLLQYGVFRSEESMNAAVQELKSKGLPSVADRTDGFRVYAGAAGSKEDAQLLAGQLTGLEVYVKPTVGGAMTVADPEGGAELAAFIERSAELTRLLSRLSIDGLQEQQPMAPDSSALTALRESHRLWTESVKSISRLSGKALEAAKTMEQSLNEAVVSVDEYSRKTARFHLWNIQSDVMHAVVGDRALRTALGSAVEK